MSQKTSGWKCVAVLVVRGIATHLPAYPTTLRAPDHPFVKVVRVWKHDTTGEYASGALAELRSPTLEVFIEAVKVPYNSGTKSWTYHPKTVTVLTDAGLLEAQEKCSGKLPWDGSWFADPRLALTTEEQVLARNGDVGQQPTLEPADRLAFARAYGTALADEGPTITGHGGVSVPRCDRRN